MRRFNGPTLDAGVLTGWDDVRIFLAVATSPSFSVAAQILGTTPSTITRRIAIIENRARLNLFVRQATGIDLTAEGTALVVAAREMAEAANRFQEQLIQLTDDIHGTIRISAGEGIANYVLPHHIKALKRRRPNLITRIVTHQGASTEITDNADLFIIATGDESVLAQNNDIVYRQVGQHNFVAYAHRDYLEKLGVAEREAIETRADLSRCDLVHHSEYERFSTFANWNDLVRKRANSESLTVVDSTTGVVHMLQANGGISLLPNYSRHLRPELVPLRSSFPTVSFGLFVVATKDRYQNKSVQTAFDFLSGVFGDMPSWFGGSTGANDASFREFALSR